MIMRFKDCSLLRISELYHLKTFCEKFETHSITKVLSMSFRFWLSGVESRDFSQAEKEKPACKSLKMTTFFTQNDSE